MLSEVRIFSLVAVISCDVQVDVTFYVMDTMCIPPLEKCVLYATNQALWKETDPAGVCIAVFTGVFLNIS
jgi:hypothetical protein